MAALTHLPPEILHAILGYVDPEDLARISVTCRCLNNFIKGNNALCRAVYMRVMDEPPTRDLDFEQELHDMVMLKKLCSPRDSTDDSDLRKHLPFVYRTVTRLLNHATRVAPPPTTSIPKIKASAAASSTSGSGSSASQPTTSTMLRQSRAQTFPVSRNMAFLTRAFDQPRARANFLSRSYLYELGRGLMIDGCEAPSPANHHHHHHHRRHGSQSSSHDVDDDNDDDEDEAVALEHASIPPPPMLPPLPRRRTRSETGKRVPKPRRASESETYQMSAKLHCLYGWGLGLDDGVTPGATDAEARKRAVRRARQGGGAYSLACSKVYDLREYTLSSKWGPFMEVVGTVDADGRPGGLRVDWEKVEAILLVLGTNIRSKGLERFPIFWHLWGRPFAGVWGKSYIPWSRDKEQSKEKEMRELDRQDPFGINGSWLRVVSFLDYSDFFSFNFPIVDRAPNNLPRAPLDASQATRLILMRIRVTKIEPAGALDHPDYPVVHFDGFSRSLDGSWDENADSDLRGTVRMTPEGEVRWTSVSIFDGEERWKSEGVQLGGIRSARGVVGNWFDKDYNPQGPCGPTAYWKISDREFSSDDSPQVLLEDLFPLIADDKDGYSDDDYDESAEQEGLYGPDALGDWADEYELEDEFGDDLFYIDEEDMLNAVDEEDAEDYLDEDEEDDDDDDDSNHIV
ncbi:uncharacterized protein B0T15DRAFT_412957 [Chaetomium strumarium]|uniref:F-box domain-containing protein n=1 Tax=Chaetomium strumarium TaxID=1170767 RepID=A0AAJ0GUV1_9PEZI|nr:hypothetical protein B0T15DRAFT_412957 [Chaetomium strumarium]